MKIQSKRNPIANAFSLVEMLVVIAVIGIIAAIAVPNIGKINDAANLSKDQRNAQNFASVFASAEAAGHTFKGKNLKSVMREIEGGITITDEDSPFFNNYFGIPNMSGDNMKAAEKYLVWEDDVLKYDKGVD